MVSLLLMVVLAVIYTFYELGKIYHIAKRDSRL